MQDRETSIHDVIGNITIVQVDSFERSLENNCLSYSVFV